MANRRVPFGFVGGVKYTRSGENERTIINKALAFKETWENVKEGNEVEKPAILTDADAWDEVQAFYRNKTKVKWAREIEDAGLDLFFCKEAPLKDFLVRVIFDERNVTKKSSLSDIITDVRGVFRAIGREHDFGAGTTYKHIGDELIFSGNPMTPATDELLHKKLKEKAKSGGKTVGKEKMGKPVSVVAGYMNMIFQLRTAMDLLVRWEIGEIKQGERILNLAMLVLMYAFLLHEGARPGDVEHLHHAEMFYVLHENVYMLTMVFLHPKTLAYLWRNNALSRCVLGMYKGKDKKHVLLREKAVMPVAFNSLDLGMIYTICMRIVMSVAPEILSKKVFKAKLNLTSLRHKRNKKYDFKDFTFYSFRYAAAEEDKAAAAQVHESWTRARMGHTFSSEMKEYYARNQGKRAVIGDEEIPLGMDIYERATNPKIIKLEFIPVSASGIVPEDDDWLEKVFQDEEEMKKEFVDTAALVKKYIEDDDDEAMATLKEKYKECAERWYSVIPFGMNLKFASRITPEGMSTTFAEYKQRLEEMFEEVPAPKAIPELWSFPQVIYGNWRSLIGEADSIAKEETKKKDKKRKRQVIEDSEDAGDAEIDPNDYDFATILHHDHVVILCNDPRDTCALKLPNLEKYVWVLQVESVKVKKRTNTADLMGWFYKNDKKDITAPLVMRKKPGPAITIIEDAIVKVYGADDEEEFELTQENIEDIVARWD